jgi:hypothetical protein
MDHASASGQQVLAALGFDTNDFCIVIMSEGTELKDDRS